jgi:hypothetical protein
MELLIAAVTLVAAIYAVVPRARQLNWQLRVGFFDWVVVAVASLVVFYLEFNDFCSSRGWVIPRPWPHGITPQNTIYLVLLVAALILAFRLRFKRLSSRKIRNFRELVEQLYWDESYGELFVVLQNNLAELFRIAGSDFALSRLRSRLRRSSGNLTHGELLRLVNAIRGRKISTTKTKRYLPGFFRAIERKVSIQLLRFLPEHDAAQSTAQEVVREILLSPRFMKALVRTRPYLGLDIIRQMSHSHERHGFISLYLSELARDTTTVFYEEIANNQNLLSSHRYVLPESNRLLHFLLSDAKFAHDNAVYKPIGDYALRYLDELARDPPNDPYNRTMDDVPDPGAWESPIYATVRFFDIMVEEALYQKYPWHMWLYYMPLIVKKVARNYRLVDPLATPDADFPIRYSFLLYEIFSALSHWVEELEHVPIDQQNVVLHSTRADHENGNIPKSGILALCECARLVLESDNLTPRLKHYLMDMVFRLYFDLRLKDTLLGYATVLRNAIVRGGTYAPQNDRKYRDALVTAFEGEQSEYYIKYPAPLVAELEAAIH